MFDVFILYNVYLTADMIFVSFLLMLSDDNIGVKELDCYKIRNVGYSKTTRALLAYIA